VVFSFANNLHTTQISLGEVCDFAQKSTKRSCKLRLAEY